MLGSLILYLKGMRRMMFQLSGFYHTCLNGLYKEIMVKSPNTVRVQVEFGPLVEL